MICPLLMSAVIIAKANAQFTGDATNVAKGLTTCGDWCAWWHEGDERCLISDIAADLLLIALSLSSIAKKMPKDLAPR